MNRRCEMAASKKTMERGGPEKKWVSLKSQPIKIFGVPNRNETILISFLTKSHGDVTIEAICSLW